MVASTSAVVESAPLIISNPRIAATITTMRTLRNASREEVVSYYIASELKRLLEHAGNGLVETKAVNALNVPCHSNEGALQHMSRVLLCIYREHSWLYDRLWEANRKWTLVELTPDEIDAMPLGGSVDEFNYPKLDKLVRELKDAAEHGGRVPGINDDPQFLLTQRNEALMLKRIIVVKGNYGGRHFDYAIGDGAHRAIFLTACGAASIEAYYGQA